MKLNKKWRWTYPQSQADGVSRCVLQRFSALLGLEQLLHGVVAFLLSSGAPFFFAVRYDLKTFRDIRGGTDWESAMPDLSYFRFGSANLNRTVLPYRTDHPRTVLPYRQYGIAAQ